MEDLGISRGPARAWNGQLWALHSKKTTSAFTCQWRRMACHWFGHTQASWANCGVGGITLASRSMRTWRRRSCPRCSPKLKRFLTLRSMIERPLHRYFYEDEMPVRSKDYFNFGDCKRHSDSTPLWHSHVTGQAVWGRFP